MNDIRPPKRRYDAASLPSLCKVEWQCVMRFCSDRTSLLRLARCSRSCLAAASEPFAWESLSDRLEWFTLDSGTTIGSDFKRCWRALCGQPKAAPLGVCLERSLMRHCDVAVHVEHAPYHDADILSKTLVQIRRLRGLHIDALGVKLNSGSFSLEQWRLVELRGDLRLTIAQMNQLAVTQPLLRTMQFDLHSFARLANGEGFHPFPAVKTLHLGHELMRVDLYVSHLTSSVFPMCERLIVPAYIMNTLIRLWDGITFELDRNRRQVTTWLRVHTIQLTVTRDDFVLPDSMDATFPALRVLIVRALPSRSMDDVYFRVKFEIERFLHHVTSDGGWAHLERVELHVPGDLFRSKSSHMRAFVALQTTFPNIFRVRG